nr:aminotransferase class III-fold pyridoxal phosphate-dependent enzyme [uncultured Pseudomonas sp.]
MNSPAPSKKNPTDNQAAIDFVSNLNEPEHVQRNNHHMIRSASFFNAPTHLVHGEGVWLFDTQGRRYLDCCNNSASVGHRNPAVERAISEHALRHITHPHYFNENAEAHAERLVNSLPGDLSTCFYVSTETAAHELAIYIANTVTQKTGVIVIEGINPRAPSLNNAYAGEISPKRWPDYVAAVKPPNTYRTPPAHKEDLSNHYVNMVDRAINSLIANGSGVAAFTCDAIFSKEGCLEAPGDYFQRVYSKVRLAGGLCIADEVYAGMARTGRMWGFEQYDVIPDIVIAGQPMGTGLPMGIVITTAAIAQQFEYRDGHVSNLVSNPISTAIENVVFKIIKSQGALENVQIVGRYLRSELQSLATRHPLIGNVQGMGFIIGIELVADRLTKLPARQEAEKVVVLMRAEGILIDVAGRYGNVLTIRLPLFFSKDNCDLMTEKLHKVLSNITKSKCTGHEIGS